MPSYSENPPIANEELLSYFPKSKPIKPLQYSPLGLENLPTNEPFGIIPSGHNWLLNTGAGTFSDDVADFFSGDRSLKYVTAGDNSLDKLREDNFVPVVTGANSHLFVRWKCSKMSELSQINLLIGQGGGAFYNWTLNEFIPEVTTSELDDVWILTEVDFNHENATGAGAPVQTGIDWAQFNIKDKGNEAITIHIDGIFKFPVATSGVVILRFDDSKASHFTKAIPKLERLGWKGNFMVIPEQLKTGNLTIEQAKEMHDAGHLICCHGLTNFTTLASQSAIEKEIKAIKKGMLENGLHNGIDWFALPEGKLGGKIGYELLQKYFRGVFCSVASGAGEFNTNPIGNEFLIRTTNCDQSRTPASINTDIDNNVTNNGVCVLLIHSIETSGATGSNINEADLDTVFEHIRNSGYTVLRIDEYFDTYRT